jgi:dihydroflavonol-4-reductase
MKPTVSFWSGKQVCVTGGTGFLGYHLVAQLVKLGARVRILALEPPKTHPAIERTEVEKIFGDILDGATVRQALADCDIVFHTAGILSVGRATARLIHAIHSTGTCTALASTPPLARFVHTSSIVAVGATRTGEPLDEKSCFDLAGMPFDYMHAKRAAEEAALQAAGRGQWVVVTNPGYLIGPDDHLGSVMGRLCVRFWKGRIPFAPPGGFNLVDVRDVARGHLLAAEYGQPGRRYILGGENYRLRDFFLVLARIATMSPRLLPTLPGWTLPSLANLAECHAWLKGKEAFPSYQQAQLSRLLWFCRSDRAMAEIGYRYRPVEASLADTYRWHQARGALHLRGLNRWWMRPRSSETAAA